MRTLEYVADAADEGRAIKRVIRSRMAVSHSQLAALKQKNAVLLDGKSVHANEIVHAGQTVSLLLSDDEGGDSRVVLHLHPALAPFKAAVMPLQKNKLGDKAREVYAMLAKHFMVDYDETGSIGKRYRRQDEIGTPYCICVDFDTETTGNVTVRNRDTMQQDVVALDKLVDYISERIDF